MIDRVHPLHLMKVELRLVAAFRLSNQANRTTLLMGHDQPSPSSILVIVAQRYRELAAVKTQDKREFGE